jgi:hypothetical protein
MQTITVRKFISGIVQTNTQNSKYKTPKKNTADNTRISIGDSEKPG